MTCMGNCAEHPGVFNGGWQRAREVRSVDIRVIYHAVTDG